jgi:hypothetical protein
MVIKVVSIVRIILPRIARTIILVQLPIGINATGIYSTNEKRNSFENVYNVVI